MFLASQISYIFCNAILERLLMRYAPVFQCSLNEKPVAFRLLLPAYVLLLKATSPDTGRESRLQA